MPKNRALTLEDLEVLSLRVVDSLNGKFITEELERIKLKIGRIISICCDQGFEMIRGVKDFQLISPETRLIKDTAHKVANILESTLDKNERWIKFRALITQSRRRMQNSSVAGALPPGPRTKSRYMNFDILIKHVMNMLIIFDHGVSTPDLDIDELKKYLGWLLEFREDIYYWNRLVEIGVIARELVRTEGIHINTPVQFEDAISSIMIGYKEMQFTNKILIFLLEQSKGIANGECFIGSTEVLESLFGKLKFMEKEQTAFGFTSLVLAAAACVGPTDDKTIGEAVMSIKQSEIDAWSKREIGKSIQSQRRAVRKMIKKLTSKTGRNSSGVLEGAAVGF